MFNNFLLVFLYDFLIKIRLHWVVLFIWTDYQKLIGVITPVI